MSAGKTRVLVDLGYGELMTIERALGQRIKKYQSTIAKNPDFVPEPGRMDVNRSALHRAEHLVERIRAHRHELERDGRPPIEEEVDPDEL